MRKYSSVLQQTRLFAGVSEEEVSSLLGCLDARLREFKKGEYVFRRGERSEYIAVTVSGALHVQQDDYWGNRAIIDRIRVGDMFGESYAGGEGAILLNDVVALEDSLVIFLNVHRILTVCTSACRFHAMVVQNLFFLVSEKNRQLLQKLGHLAKRSTREKLISYLSEEAERQRSPLFTIPFNRQQLADYLSVDRSAMSQELGKMRDEGLLEFHKSTFKLLKIQN